MLHPDDSYSSPDPDGSASSPGPVAALNPGLAVAALNPGPGDFVSIPHPSLSAVLNLSERNCTYCTSSRCTLGRFCIPEAVVGEPDAEEAAAGPVVWAVVSAAAVGAAFGADGAAAAFGADAAALIGSVACLASSAELSARAGR